MVLSEVWDLLYLFGCQPKKRGKKQNGWFIRENPIKMDDLAPISIFGNTQMIFAISSYMTLIQLTKTDGPQSFGCESPVDSNQN